LNDFDFKKPKTSLGATTNVSRKYGKAKFEMYDYPGEYLEHGEGDRLADVRLNELQTQYEILHGQASARGLAAGCTFKLKNHPRGDQNREYLITGVLLHADAGEFATASAGGNGSDFFSCSFTAIDSKQTFRPPRLTPKPIVQGPQTAIVAGPGGEEIYTDEHGRVKVQFHWDRYGKSDENSSCWMRVSQAWAGKTWGSIHIPRIGQEVIVEFLEGDPDRPIITGRVYNADATPPYGLPGNKTQSGIKSRSSKGGGSANFNEIRFEDKKGSEEVYIHAEKDQNNIVENDETTSVGHDRTEDVGNDEKITIGKNRTEKVGVNEKISIGANRTEDVGANEDITIGASRTRTVAINDAITIGVAQEISVGAAQAITVGAAQAISVGASQSTSVGINQDNNIGVNQSTDVGSNQSNSIGGNQNDKVTKNRSSSVGENDTLKVAKKLSIDAGEEVLIKTGDASIHMKKDGTIQIKGKDIAIQGSGKISVKADGDITMKGSKIAAN